MLRSSSFLKRTVWRAKTRAVSPRSRPHPPHAQGRRWRPATPVRSPRRGFRPLGAPSAWAGARGEETGFAGHSAGATRLNTRDCLHHRRLAVRHVADSACAAAVTPQRASQRARGCGSRAAPNARSPAPRAPLRANIDGRLAADDLRRQRRELGHVKRGQVLRADASAAWRQRCGPQASGERACSISPLRCPFWSAMTPSAWARHSEEGQLEKARRFSLDRPLGHSLRSRS